jgi:hypothetical protein
VPYTCLAVVTAALLVPACAASSSDGNRQSAADQAPNPQVASLPTVDGCTIALPRTRATVEVRITNAGDFCELTSQALADEVFRAALVVTPGSIWHYPGSTVSCRLRFPQTSYGITIRNAPAACHWLTRRSAGWGRAGLVRR